MPKERFNEEKKGIAVRIQELIAQGESIMQMMEVWAVQGLDRRARRTARWDGRKSAGWRRRRRRRWTSTEQNARSWTMTIWNSARSISTTKKTTLSCPWRSWFSAFSPSSSPSCGCSSWSSTSSPSNSLASRSSPSSTRCSSVWTTTSRSWPPFWCECVPAVTRSCSSSRCISCSARSTADSASVCACSSWTCTKWSRTTRWSRRSCSTEGFSFSSRSIV